MADKVRIGVIGVGQIGKSHLNNYSKLEAADVVAVADLNEDEAKSVAAQHDIPDVYADFRDLLARDDIEAVDVCLHNNLHMPVTTAGLRAGKHVYCEKPMAGSYIDAETMLQTAAECDRKLSIQLATVFANETRAAKELIDGGHLGNVYHARSTGFRRRGRPFVDGYGTSSFVQKNVAAGGALYDMGVYHIARMLHLLGNPAVERISGKTYQEVEMDAARRESSNYDVEELGLGFVRLAGGVTLDIIESWAINLDGFEGSSIVGNKGGVRLDPFSFSQNLGHLSFTATANLGAASFRWQQLTDQANCYDGAQPHWVAALQGRVPLLPTAELALATMLISEGIYLSNELGREVTAEEVRENSNSTAVQV